MAPSPADVQRIVAIENPVVRNLEITYCYSQLAAACVERNGTGANWCTYATWASRQAGRTIRGEDLLEHLERRLGQGRRLLHPFATLGRWFLRRALTQAFAHYDRVQLERDPKKRAELALLANLEIGLHEQTRLQPQILEALDAAYATQEDLGRRVLEALFPSATGWWAVVRGPAATAIGVWARAIQRSASRLAREAITDSLMVLTLPGRVLMLGTNLTDAYPPELTEPADPELKELLARFEPAPPAPDDCGARDWSNLHQRMHYIVHLFRVFHLSEQLSEPPFNAGQVATFSRGVIPDGEL